MAQKGLGGGNTGGAGGQTHADDQPSLPAMQNNWMRHGTGAVQSLRTLVGSTLNNANIHGEQELHGMVVARTGRAEDGSHHGGQTEWTCGSRPHMRILVPIRGQVHVSTG